MIHYTCRLRLYVCLLSMHRVKGLAVDDDRRFIRLGIAVGPMPGESSVSDLQLWTVRQALYARFDTTLNKEGYAISSTASKWLVIARVMATPERRFKPVKVLYLCAEIISLSDLMPSTPWQEKFQYHAPWAYLCYQCRVYLDFPSYWLSMESSELQ